MLKASKPHDGKLPLALLYCPASPDAFLLLVLPHLMTLAKLQAAYSTCCKTHSVPK